MIRLHLIALVLGAATAWGAQAHAQDAVDDLFADPGPPPERTDTADDNPAPAEPAALITVEEKPAYDPEIEVTQALNADVEARNRAVREANAAAEAAYRNQSREHAEWVARLEREHQAEQAAYEAEVVRRRQAHEAEIAAWRRRVAACRAGDLTQCEPAPPR